MINFTALHLMHQYPEIPLAIYWMEGDGDKNAAIHLMAATVIAKENTIEEVYQVTLEAIQAAIVTTPSCNAQDQEVDDCIKEVQRQMHTPMFFAYLQTRIKNLEEKVNKFREEQEANKDIVNAINLITCLHSSTLQMFKQQGKTPEQVIEDLLKTSRDLPYPRKPHVVKAMQELKSSQFKKWLVQKMEEV